MRKNVKQSVQAVPFRRRPLRFLVLHSKKEWSGWEFPKGGRNKNEPELATLKRELLEETGLRPMRVICRLPFSTTYKWSLASIRASHNVNKYTHTHLACYLVEVKPGRVRLDLLEHDAYRWVSPQQADRLLRYAYGRRTLKAALKVLNK